MSKFISNLKGTERRAVQNNSSPNRSSADLYCLCIFTRNWVPTASSCSNTNYWHVAAQESNTSYLTPEEVASKVHSMELLAYYSALRAFYVCGPLSWEREALLSNLRLFLNISNDEHLFEVKRLCSTKNL